MPRTTFAGHALHPQLVLLPGGLLPFSAVLDAMSLATGKREYSDAAYYTLAGGLGLAAMTGRRRLSVVVCVVATLVIELRLTTTRRPPSRFDHL